MQPVQVLVTHLDSIKEVSFSGPNLNQVPNLTLNCQIVSSNGNYLTTTSGSRPFTCTFPANLSEEVFNLEITPTVDETNLSFQPFKFAILLPPPSVSYSNCFISSNGLTLLIIFTKAVDLSFLKYRASVDRTSLCETILTSTSSQKLSIYQPLKCIWSSKVQLLIYTSKPILERTLQVSLRKGSFKREGSNGIVNQHSIKIEIKKLSTDWFNYSSKVVITGPNQIPYCGFFSLSAHYSSSTSSNGVSFYWNITKDGQYWNNKNLSSSFNTQNIVLDSQLFEAGCEYTFTVYAFLQSQHVLTASHRLIKLKYKAPIVSIHSNAMIPFGPFTVNTK